MKGDIIMSCVEHLRKNKEKTDDYNRLNSYFNALEQDETEEYHDRHKHVWLKTYDDRYKNKEEK